MTHTSHTHILTEMTDATRRSIVRSRAGARFLTRAGFDGRITVIPRCHECPETASRAVKIDRRWHAACSRHAHVIERLCDTCIS